MVFFFEKYLLNCILPLALAAKYFGFVYYDGILFRFGSKIRRFVCTLFVFLSTFALLFVQF